MATGLQVGIGIVVFCLLSSAVYILNDLLDRNSDRLHKNKRNRPFASGKAKPVTGMILILLLAVLGTTIALTLPPTFLWVAESYLLLQILYCLVLKHHSIVDVLTIAIGFVLRVEAGGAIIGVTPTSWIIIATGLLALFQGFAKRRDDLVQALNSNHRRSLAGYNKAFLDMAVSITLGALLVSYLIYTTDTAVMERLGTQHLFYTAPFVVAGILRYMQITLVEEKSGSPTEIMLTDRFIICAVVGWALSFLIVLHV